MWGVSECALYCAHVQGKYSREKCERLRIRCRVLRIRNVLIRATVIRVIVVARKTREKKNKKGGGGSDGGREYDSFAGILRRSLRPLRLYSIGHAIVEVREEVELVAWDELIRSGQPYFRSIPEFAGETV